MLRTKLISLLLLALAATVLGQERKISKGSSVYHFGRNGGSLTCPLEAHARNEIVVDFDITVSLLYPQRKWPDTIQATDVQWPAFRFVNAEKPAPSDWIRPSYYPPTGSDKTLGNEARMPSSFVYQFKALRGFRLEFSGEGIWKVDYTAAFDEPKEIKPLFSKKIVSTIGNSKRVRVQVQEEASGGYGDFKTIEEEVDVPSGEWQVQISRAANKLPEIELIP